PKDVVFNSLDTTVSQRINAAILALTNSGVQVERIEMPEFNQLAYINRNGGFVCAEAWALHRDLISEHQDLYDPRVAKRILIGKDQSAADYIDLLAEREQWIRAVEERLEAYEDRKSTRLNSSHVSISYAVFCLKKQTQPPPPAPLCSFDRPCHLRDLHSLPTRRSSDLLHRDLISEHQDLYDPRVAKRILIGKDQSAADYIDLLAEREQWIRAVEERLEAY